MTDLYSIIVTTRYYLLAASEQEAEESAKAILTENGGPSISVYRTPNQDFELKMRAANFCGRSGEQDD